MSTRLYGLMAVFNDPEELVEAARKTQDQGYRKFDAYSPFPVEGLAEAMKIRHTWVAPICWFGGFLGVTGALALQCYDTIVDFALNVGGRPLFSWPAYVPITFELMVLTGGTFTFFAVILLNRLPQYYHPVFNVEEFQKRNSNDGFFLVIEAEDPRFNPSRTHEFLRSLHPVRTYEVPDAS